MSGFNTAHLKLDRRSLTAAGIAIPEVRPGEGLHPGTKPGEDEAARRRKRKEQKRARKRARGAT